MSEGIGSEVRRLDVGDAPEVIDVLCNAFRDYPVMRFVVGDAPDYDARLRTLVGFFTMARVHREETMLGISSGGGLVAVALLSRPGPAKKPEALRALRDRVWAELGGEARARYEAFGAATLPFAVDAPHIHLNMLGTRAEAQGTGLGRRLIERVHELSVADPESVGVTLTTEDPTNVALYEHFGYRVVGEARVAPELYSWGFFRPDRDEVVR